MRKLTGWFKRQRNRAYLYRVLAALGLPAVFYGVASEQEVVIWLAVAEVGLGVAAANTPTKEQ